MTQAVLESKAANGGGVVADGLVRVLGGRRVLDGIDLRLPEQGRIGIVGRSGAGKSTLLSLRGSTSPTEGRSPSTAPPPRANASNAAR